MQKRLHLGGVFSVNLKQVCEAIDSVRYLVHIAFLLLGCSGLSACTSSLPAAYKMVQALEKPDPARFENFDGNPDLQLLEVHSPTSQAMLVLGYVTTPTGQPPIQTWYDAEQQLLRLQNGFLINLTGVENAVSGTDYVWQGSTDRHGLLLPTAKTYSQPAQQLFNKTVELGYRPVPAKNVDSRNSVLRKRLLKADSTTSERLLWYQEMPVTGHLSENLYAFNQGGVPVYGSHCLARGECVEWLFKNPGGQKP